MASKLTRPHEEATIERFRRDPELAAEYLHNILQRWRRCRAPAGAATSFQSLGIIG